MFSSKAKPSSFSSLVLQAALSSFLRFRSASLGGLEQDFARASSVSVLPPHLGFLRGPEMLSASAAYRFFFPFIMHRTLQTYPTCTVAMHRSACDWPSCCPGRAGAASRKCSASSRGPTSRSASRCPRGCRRNVSSVQHPQWSRAVGVCCGVAV